MNDVVYIVMVNADAAEGKGPMVPHCVCEDYKLAAKIAVDLEPYGISGQFNNVMKMPITKSYVTKREKDKIRLKALSKLTEEEKDALGVK